MSLEKIDPVKNRRALTRYAWLSISGALATIVLKSIAYFLTGSVGLLSDAIESLVNLAGATMALGMLTIAALPPDESHMYGHGKAEYFSSSVEGVLILGASAGIIVSALPRLLAPRPLADLGLGLAVSTVAAVINFVIARILLRAGLRENSITLEADARHLMTDVWTSVGVLGGVGLVALTGWLVLDPIVALLVAANIIWTGVQLVRRSVEGLMDTALSAHDKELIEAVMDKYRKRGVGFHALRTRQAAVRRFISVHVLVPGHWTVHDAHQVAEAFEGDMRTALGTATVFTHIEPSGEKVSLDDIPLDR